MINKLLRLFLLISVGTGCAQVTKEFDATWTETKTVYQKGVPLPPLTIPPTLAQEHE